MIINQGKGLCKQYDHRAWGA